MFRRPTAASLRTPEIVGEVTNPVMKQSVVSGGERSIEFCDCMVLCSALSRLRASSTHASGKLAIEAASPFLIRPRLEFSYNRTEATRLGYRSSSTVERQHDTKAVRRRKIAFAPLCPRPRQFSESHDDLVVIGGIPTLEGRIPMSDGAGRHISIKLPWPAAAPRRRLRATRIRSASLPDPAASFANSRYFRPVSPKETRIHKWDQEFESAFLQRGVRCEPGLRDESHRTAVNSMPVPRRI